MDPVHWASESFSLAAGNAYWFDVKANDTVVTTSRNYPENDACPLKLVELTEGYYSHSLRIIHQRLIYTAIRLAFHLNSIFVDYP